MTKWRKLRGLFSQALLLIVATYGKLIIFIKI